LFHGEAFILADTAQVAAHPFEVFFLFARFHPTKLKRNTQKH
jgi:hypothetical protein